MLEPERMVQSDLLRGIMTDTLCIDDVVPPLSEADIVVVKVCLGWTRSRQIYVLDDATQWALAQTRPPEWWDEQGGCVRHALGAPRAAFVWLQFAQPIEWGRRKFTGCYIGDAMDGSTVEGRRLRAAYNRGDVSMDELAARAALTHICVVAMADGYSARILFPRGEFAAVAAQVQERWGSPAIAHIALNFLAAMRYTKRLEATTHTLPKASPKEERHERRTGRTRAPWTTIRLAVGGSEPAIQREIQTRAPAASTGATHASPVSHWVTGHWHRYWVLQPDVNDKPDATKDEDGRVLYRVARWLQPYFVDGPACDPAAPRVAKVVLA